MSDAPKFTAADKLEAVRREIGQRKYVYKRLVEEKKRTQAWANREIAVMEAIAEDYEPQAAKERLL